MASKKRIKTSLPKNNWKQLYEDFVDVVRKLQETNTYLNEHISQLQGDLSLQEGIVQIQREHMTKLRATLKLAQDTTDEVLNYLALNAEQPIFRAPRIRIVDGYNKLVLALKHLTTVLSMNNSSPDEILKLAQSQTSKGFQAGANLSADRVVETGSVVVNPDGWQPELGIR